MRRPRLLRRGALPIRWRLALTSAGLTLVILLLFAIVMGTFTSRKLHSDFDRDLRLAAAELQDTMRVRGSMFGDVRIEAEERAIFQAAAAGGAAVRLVTPEGGVHLKTGGAPNLGPPRQGLTKASGYRVASRPLSLGTRDAPVAYLQYGKPEESVNSTMGRVWLLLGLGVVGGTGLALLAGLAVARRAMRPIAGLTAAAQTIARTRDPDRRLPALEGSDEVTALSRTLDEMLRALADARKETEGLLARQREFVADASHELRTPLTSVLANLELLEADLAGEDAAMASSALRSARRMRRLVGDLLLLARADEGRPAAREPLDLSAVLRAAAAEAEQDGGRELQLEAPPGIPVLGAKDELHRLALNLIENGLIHTPPGTAVAASVRREREVVVLEVSDDGPGIPAELRERIFDRFVRGGGETGGGSGLGLAIVRAVAEGHGGSVEVGESPAGGARFTVRLPATAAPTDGRVEVAQPAGWPGL